MKKLFLALFLLIPLVFSFINCTNASSLKNTIWVFPAGSAISWSYESIMEWNGIFNPKREYIAVKFIDDTNATYYVLNNNSVILETHNIKYFYENETESGYLIFTNKGNRKLFFKALINPNPKRIWISSSERADDSGISLYKEKSLTN